MTDRLTELLPGGSLGQICAEAMSALSATEPKAASDILGKCESAEGHADLSRAIYALKSRGLIVHAGDRAPSGKPGSRRARLYVLSDRVTNLRLAEHLERELAEHQKLSETERNLAERAEEAEDPSEPEACLDSAHGSSEGDEFASSHLPWRIEPAASHACISDPLLSAIERLEEPHIVDAERHAMLLRKLAASPVLRSEPDVGAWLNDIAEFFESRASS